MFLLDLRVRRLSSRTARPTILRHRILREVTDNEELAAEFAMQSQPHLDGESIVSHCTTQEGIKAVEGFLTQVEFGVYV